MGREKDSELIKLARGEGGSLWLSLPERRLLKFALDKFGLPLSQFLLFGLGQESDARRWLVIITFIDKSGTKLRRRLYVEADNLMPDILTLLPRQREPLVMLALLRLLMRDHKVSSASLFYDQNEVLSYLGWEDTAESRLVIDEVVERYSYLTYRWAFSKKELAARKLSFYRCRERFVSRSGYRDVEEGQDGQLRRVVSYVNFDVDFIKQLISRSLFGVNWDSIISLKRVIL